MGRKPGAGARDVPEADARTAGRVLRLLDAAYPRLESPLDHRTPLQLLLSAILSAQCTDAQVNRATPALFRKYPAAGDIARAPLRDLERLVHSCGFYRQKARALRGCCRSIVEEFGGEVPRTREELVRLSGVGDKTANVVLNGAFGQPAIAVDTHVLRTSNRLGWARTRDPRKAEAQILETIPKRWWKKFSLIMIAHGRQRCRARKPDCPGCPVLRYCPYGRKGGG